MSDRLTLRAQTEGLRRAIHALLAPEAHRADRIPPGWRNHLRWHLGHLVVTPHLLTEGLAGLPLSLPAGFRERFAKGTAPSDWVGDEAGVPSFETLLAALVPGTDALFDRFEGAEDTPFPRPYPTSLGVVLHSPREAFLYSYGHDALHLGSMRALLRSLDSLPPDSAS